MNTFYKMTDIYRRATAIALLWVAALSLTARADQFEDRLSTARSLASAGQPDSALAVLDQIATDPKFLSTATPANTIELDHTRGSILLNSGRLALARPVLAKALNAALSLSDTGAIDLTPILMDCFSEAQMEGRTYDELVMVGAALLRLRPAALPAESLTLYARTLVFDALEEKTDTALAVAAGNHAVLALVNSPATPDTILGQVGFWLGAAFADLHDFKNSVTAWRNTEKLFSKASGDRNTWSVLCLLRAGTSLRALSESSEARSVLLDALRRIDAVSTLDSTNYALGASILGGVCFDIKSFDSAASYYRTALEWYTGIGDTMNQSIPMALENLATTCSNGGNKADAMTYLVTAIEWRRKYRAEADQVQIAFDLNQLGNLVLSEQSADQAAPYYRQAIAAYELASDTTSQDFMTVLGNLGYVLETGNPLAADSVYARLIPLLEQYSLDTSAIIGALTGYGNVAMNLNQPARAESVYQQALQLSTVTGTIAAGNYQVWRKLATAIGHQGRLAESDSLYQLAAYGLSHQNPPDTVQLAELFSEQGVLLRYLQQWPQAETCFQKAWRLDMACKSSDHMETASTGALWVYTVINYGDLGRGDSLATSLTTSFLSKAPKDTAAFVLLLEASSIGALRVKDYERSALLYQKLVSCLKALSPPDSVDIAEKLGTLGAVSVLGNDLTRAGDALREAYELWCTYARNRGSDTTVARNVADVLTNLGQMYDKLEDEDSASSYFRQAIAVADSALPADDRVAQANRLKFINHLMTKERYSELEPLLVSLMKSAERYYGPEDTMTLAVLTIRGTVDVLTGKILEGQELIRNVVATRRRIGPVKSTDMADAMILIALGHRSAGNYFEAEQLMKKVIGEQSGTEYFDQSYYSNALTILGSIYLSQWKLPAAESLYTSLLEQERTQWSKTPRIANQQLSTLAFIYTLQGQFDLARRTIDTFELISANDQGSTSYSSQNIATLRGDLAAQQGDYAHAAEFYHRALILLDSTGSVNPNTSRQLRSKYASALVGFRQFAMADSILPPLDSVVVRSELASSQQSFDDLVVRGDILFGRGQLDSASDSYHQVLGLVVGHEPQYANAVAGALIGLGELSLEKQQFLAADSFYSRAASLLYRYLGEYHPLYPRALLGLARVSMARALFAQAGDQIARSISITRRVLGDNHPLLAAGLDLQGQLFTQQARYLDAESSLAAAHDILSRLQGQQTYGDLIYQKRLAQLALARSDVADALIKYGAVINPMVTELGYAHSEVVSAFLQCTDLLLQTGQYAYVDTVLRFFDRIGQEELGQRPLTSTGVELVRGRLAMTHGDYASAEKLFRSAVTQRRSAMGDNDPSLGECYAALGNLYADQNRVDEAERARKQAVAVYRSGYGDLHPMVAWSTLKLAEGYRDRGEYAEAERLFRDALQTFSNLYGTMHASVAASLDGLADIHQRQGHHDEAATFYNQELAITVKLYGNLHPLVARNLVSIGNVDLSLRRYAEADTLFAQTLDIFSKMQNATSPDIVPALIGTSRCAALMGDWNRSLTASWQAYTTAHQAFARNSFALSEADAMAYSKQISEAAQMFLTAYWRAESTSTDWTEQAAQIVFQVKGQVSEEVFRRKNVILTIQDSTVRALATMRDSLLVTRSHWLTEARQDESTASRHQAVDRRISEIEAELALKSSDFGATGDTTELSAADIAQHLPTGSALIEYFKYVDQLDEIDTTRDRYLAVVVRPAVPPALINLGQANQLDSSVSAYRRHINKVTSTGYKLVPLDGVAYTTRSRSVWNLVWRPLESALHDASIVLIAPDASLNLVSFAALKDSTDTYLVEKFPIHYLSSGRDLLRPAMSARLDDGLFAMGDPDYNASPQARIKGSEFGLSSSRYSQNSASRSSRSTCGSLANLNASPLPSTRREIDNIVGRWDTRGSGAVAEFLGTRATEDNFKRFSPGHRVIHLATHGFYLVGDCSETKTMQRRLSESPLLQSGLLLAGANLHGEGADSAGIDDGILTAEEVASLPLSGTRLIVLSACESGLGEVRAGEGVFGLRRAFLLAGAHAVISSLWSVPDRETADMMSLLYANQNRTLPEVMREIQLARISEIRKSGAVDHPFTWGAFIVLGDWK